MKFESQSKLKPEPQLFCLALLREKFALQGETSKAQIRQRVATHLGRDDAQASYFFGVMETGFVPGDRINRAAGAGLNTTMINRFVQPVGDTMTGKDKNGVVGIMDALAQSAETMRKGGGVGYDFSPIRPHGALVNGTTSLASGPVSYMRVFDRTCETLAAGSPLMGVLRVDHPDIEKFIDAKTMPDFAAMGLDASEHKALMAMIFNKHSFGWTARKAFATLSNFTLSVAVTDEFMEAVMADADFDLVHEADPGTTVIRIQHGPDGKTRYVYSTVKARTIWDKIMRVTYELSETSGLSVSFIDRVNQDNNLGYAERLDASNSWGEQFLPAHGCCDSGSVSLGNFVHEAFEPTARFDWDGFKSTVQGGVELLDRVLNKTNWPLPEQAVEATNKRRIGLGYFGLADAMTKLGIRYDSPKGVQFAEQVTTVMRDTAYMKSVDLAKELGAFPLFNADLYLKTGTFASRLPQEIQDAIRKHGIRNSHLLSLAPTDIISMAFADNASHGIEPISSKRQKHTKIMPGGQREDFDLDNAAYREFLLNGGDASKAHLFVTAIEMSVDDHLNVLEAVAPFIDGAISKTVNVPADYPLEDFANVHMRAWKSGLKGIRIYQPTAMVGM